MARRPGGTEPPPRAGLGLVGRGVARPRPPGRPVPAEAAVAARPVGADGTAPPALDRRDDDVVERGGGAPRAAVEPREPAPPVVPAGLREHPARRLARPVLPDLAVQHPAGRPQLEVIPGPHLPRERVEVAPRRVVVQELHPAVAEEQVVPRAVGRLRQAHARPRLSPPAQLSTRTRAEISTSCGYARSATIAFCGSPGCSADWLRTPSCQTQLPPTVRHAGPGDDAAEVVAEERRPSRPAARRPSWRWSPTATLLGGRIPGGVGGPGRR